VYRIFKEDGTEIGVADELNYIKVSSNGTFILCEESEAVGIAFNGTPYSLMGTEGIESLDKVTATFVEYSKEIMDSKTVNSINFVTLAEQGSIDPVTAGEHADLFAEWAYPIAYTAGQIRRYNGTLYKCVQAHTSQADWTPPAAPSLWSLTSDPAEEWPEWSQPLGAHDAYPLGAKVRHNEKHWTSTIANNVWEPGVYGWTEVTEKATEE
jgi:hypothetical protein